jgi:hypothetical protein
MGELLLICSLVILVLLVLFVVQKKKEEKMMLVKLKQNRSENSDHNFYSESDNKRYAKDDINYHSTYLYNKTGRIPDYSSELKRYSPYYRREYSPINYSNYKDEYLFDSRYNNNLRRGSYGDCNNYQSFKNISSPNYHSNKKEIFYECNSGRKDIAPVQRNKEIINTRKDINQEYNFDHFLEKAKLIDQNFSIKNKPKLRNSNGINQFPHQQQRPYNMNGNINLDQNSMSQYRIINFEDFQNNNIVNDSQTPVKKHIITLDEISQSLIKFLNTREELSEIKSPLGSNIKIETAEKIKDNFCLSDLIPKSTNQKLERVEKFEKQEKQEKSCILKDRIPDNNNKSKNPIERTESKINDQIEQKILNEIVPKKIDFKLSSPEHDKDIKHSPITQRRNSTSSIGIKTEKENNSPLINFISQSEREGNIQNFDSFGEENKSNTK